MTTIDQLDAEVTALKKRQEQQTRLENQVKLLTALVAVGTFAWAILQYGCTSRNEFRKTFWEHQFTLYQQATSAAATIATARDIHQVEAERKTFWRLYYGELSIIEHPQVKDAMIAFGKQLKEVEARDGDLSSLKQLSYKLARECRLSLGKTWNPVDIGDISEDTDIQEPTFIK
jgi:hypothetical protein